MVALEVGDRESCFISAISCSHQSLSGIGICISVKVVSITLLVMKFTIKLVREIDFDGPFGRMIATSRPSCQPALYINNLIFHRVIR